MLWTIAVLMLVLWAVGLVSSYTMVMVLINLIGGRRAI
jgi:hypothetical protein